VSTPAVVPIPQGATIGSPTPTAPANPSSASGGVVPIPEGATGPGVPKPPAPVAPSLTPDEQASKTRQMMVSGLTGMPSPVMNEQDKAEFEQGKAAGAVSVPIVAGTTLGVGQIYAGAHALVPALTRGVVGVGEWAAEHPQTAKAIWEGLKLAAKVGGLYGGARVAGKVIRAGDE